MVKRGEFYRNLGDNRIYQVLAVAKGLDVNNGGFLVTFKQVVNAKDDNDMAVNGAKLGKKSYSRTIASFKRMYGKVNWENPVPKNGWVDK